MHDILMPQVAKATGSLTVKRWLKSLGQAVAKGELIAQVESSAGLVELESSQAGVLVEILTAAGKSCPTGTLIARIKESQSATGQVTLAEAVTSKVETSGTSAAATSAVPLLMPAAGNSMEEGTIVKWRVKVGDRIKKGDIIYEVETDKATMEVEATEEGRLARIVTPEGAVQKVKEPVAYLSEAELTDADLPTSSGGMLASKAEAYAPASAGSMPADAAPILMPAAGNSMEEGTIVKWRVAVGDRIKKGQIIFEVETDKATMEVEATEEGRLAAIVSPEGAVQKVKEPVAYLSESDITLAAAVPQSEQPRKAQKTQEEPAAAAPTAVTSTSSVAAPSSDGRVKASPAARKLATEKGLNLASVGVGSGPGGRILSTDLLRAKPAAVAKSLAKAEAAECPPVQTLATTQITRKKMSKMRKAIAANLQQSKQTIPHFYLRATVNADALMAFYRGEKAKYPCSINDVVTLACAKAIIEFPAFHSKIEGDEIVEYPNVNIGVAVGVEDGLTVPVILGAHAMNLQQIAANTRRVVEGARAGKLEGYGQGNFTITNLGMFGVEEFAAIVNPPEPAILAVGAAREAVIVKDGFMKPGKVMTMTLSCDHRIIDGLLAAKFMARLKQLLENPAVLA